MISWLLATTLTGGLITVLILLFKRKLIKRLGTAGYYLTSVIMLTLFIIPWHQVFPSDFSSQILNNSLEMIHNQEVVRVNEKVPSADPPPSEHILSPQLEATSIEHASPLLSKLIDLPALWAGGCLIMLSRYFVSYYRFKRKVLAHKPAFIDHIGRLNIVTSKYVLSPLIIGFFKPVIVIPEQQISESNCHLAILHEWNHYRQGDAWIKLLAVVINSIHWFNPVTYLMLANLSEACEYACDEKVTRKMSIDDKRAYSEMILAFASRSTPALSSNLAKSKKQLLRRFELIMSPVSKGQGYLGVLLVTAMTAASLLITTMVFAESPKTKTQYVGEMFTYYNVYSTLDQNIKSTFGLGNIGVIDGPFCIDANGLKVDYYNRTEPYYMINRSWKLKDNALEQKVLSIDGKNVTVAFTKETAAYQDDSVIEKMVRNQIEYELTYKNTKWNHDHLAFINEVISQGMMVVQNVTEPKDFKFIMSTEKNGDQWGMKPLTRYDAKTKVKSIFNQKVKLAANINGKQGKQIGDSFVIKNGETLAIDFKKTTDSMPQIYFSVINVRTGKPVMDDNYLGSGNRFIFIPGKQSVNSTFKVIMSGEGGSDTGEVEIFTYK
ncbi:M56 family metallopeptidase [Paenibacillus agri]|uniref:M56 family metallopeptidase n=1 Tax=Paenibacillus agri TaxID=2744309 RepID=A0A850EVU1_9BACL|nr:M56 family metallopeptidase [Paenibacillus agri]NUU63574.1 M56 family metallopeptidase [Paenibacillus agri]